MEINDWLIVVVENFDGKRANKLLPRTTVLDKIRADFAPKQGIFFLFISMLFYLTSKNVLLAYLSIGSKNVSLGQFSINNWINEFPIANELCPLVKLIL